MAGGTAYERASQELLTGALDRVAAGLIEKCDVFIGMSGMSNASGAAARRRHGARVFIERGSRHILSQKEILDALPGTARGPSSVSQSAVRRELEGYALADRIVVPARHVVESFVERGVPSAKLLRNPYGVSLDMFPPTDAPSPDPPTILMAGTWSLQKGCDVLSAAWRRMLGVRLIHVGTVGDAPLPDKGEFEHQDSVDQTKLAQSYARAHVLVLASRQEGLALVQAQALACGLPVVCTTRTGGQDLGELIDNPSLVSVVAPDDANALARALGNALQSSRRMTGKRDLLGPAREKLSWRSYGQRYDAALKDYA